jgi:hypothetical protein
MKENAIYKKKRKYLFGITGTINPNSTKLAIVKKVAKNVMKTVNAIHLNVKTSLKFQNKFFKNLFFHKFHST